MLYKYETADDLERAIAWEGSIFDALYYGIKENEIGDLELRELWSELEEAMIPVNKIIERINERLYKNE